MLKVKRLVLCTVCAVGLSGSTYGATVSLPTFLEMGSITLDSLYSHYATDHPCLLREHYPFDSSFKADYLADENAKKGNPYSYLWPYSGTLSAAKAMYDATGERKYLTLIERQVIPGLECYRDTLRNPVAFASYIAEETPSDRFYDDNDWIGIDLTELYLNTGDPKYLEKALEIWNFIESGKDSKLGGGIYWCEQKKYSKNTCSNAPAAVMAVRLFQATGDSLYLSQAQELYGWTQENLCDPSDGLYFDNKKLNGHLGRMKYAYNSGQMLEAATLLYEATGHHDYLEDALKIAENASRRFINGATVTDGQGEFNLFTPGAIWFTSIMMRGFDELARVTGDPSYMDAFTRIMEYAWNSMRDPATGLFNEDWTGIEKKDKKWLLTQTAMVEMYARAAQYVNR